MTTKVDSLETAIKVVLTVLMLPLLAWDAITK